MRPRVLVSYFLVAVAVIVSDQIAKFLAVRWLPQNEPVSVIGDLLYFRLIYNQGGAMGTSLGPSWLYTLLTLVALVLIARFFVVSQSTHTIVNVSLALIFGGAVGNLIDRIRFGKVIDFIDFDFPDIPFLNLYRWYTFNIADSAITVGLILFAIHLLWRRAGRADPSADLPVGAVSDPDGDAS